MNLLQPKLDSPVDWSVVEARVKSDDPRGKDELHRVFSHGIRFCLSRRLGLQQLEARVQETFAILINAIKTQDLREHQLLVGLVRTIVLQQVASYSAAYVQTGSRPSVEAPAANLHRSCYPDKKAIHLPDGDRMLTVLRSMSLRDQEALTRFYLHEQTQERICEEMKLSETQFLLLKARARASFGETTVAAT